MSVTQSGKIAHDNACNKLEAVRQAAVAGATPANARAADIAFHRALIAQCVADGLSPSIYLYALRELGVHS